MNTSGVDDADDWYNRWQNRHHSDLFPGNFARLALAALESADDGLGAEQLRYAEGDRVIEVTITYLLETFPSGRVLHVLSILSPDDPIPSVDP